MTCPHCKINFFESKAKSIDRDTLICPECSAMINKDGSKPKISNNNSPRRSSSRVADIIRCIAYITWGAGIALTVMLYMVIEDLSIIMAIAVAYSSFVSGMIFYAFGEIVLLLTEIRNNQKK